MIRIGMAAAALAAFGGCSGQQAANSAGSNDAAGVNASAMETNLSALPGESAGNIGAAPEPAAGTGNPVEATPAPAVRAAEKAKAPAAERAAPRERPAARPAPKQEPADPHAGHDPNTMNHH